MARFTVQCLQFCHHIYCSNTTVNILCQPVAPTCFNITPVLYALPANFLGRHNTYTNFGIHRIHNYTIQRSPPECVAEKTKLHFHHGTVLFTFVSPAFLLSTHTHLLTFLRSHLQFLYSSSSYHTHTPSKISPTTPQRITPSHFLNLNAHPSFLLPHPHASPPTPFSHLTSPATNSWEDASVKSLSHGKLRQERRYVCSEKPYLATERLRMSYCPTLSLLLSKKHKNINT